VLESPETQPDAFSSQDIDAISGNPALILDFGQYLYDFEPWHAQNAADVENLSSGNQRTINELGKPNQRVETSYAE
jgi:hypothetical protein